MDFPLTRVSLIAALLTAVCPAGEVCAGGASPEVRAESLADVPFPWQRSAGAGGAAAGDSNPRQWLESAEIDASRLANLSLGQPLDAGDEETVLAVLYRLPRLSTATLEQWTTTSVSWPDVAERVQRHQAQVFRVSGRAKQVERVELLPETAERLEFDHYFRVLLDLEPAGWPATLCVRSVPRAWPDNGALDERVAAQGLLLKTGPQIAARQQLVFTAARMMWFPDRVNTALGIGAAQVQLAGLGMDLARFDDLRDSDRKPLGDEEGECFYELLAALQRASHPSLLRHAAKKLDLPLLLNRPSDARGRLLEVRGTVRRIQRIEVTDPSLRQRLGVDHYYQVDVFVPLGDRIVKLGEGRPGEESPTFVNTFPVIVCTPSLPKGLNAELDMQVDVSIPAVFLKLWAFRSQYVASFDKQQLQLGPLLVGCCPAVIPPPTDQFKPYTTALGCILLCALLAGGYGLWRWQRAEARAHRSRRKR